MGLISHGHRFPFKDVFPFLCMVQILFTTYSSDSLKSWALLAEVEVMKEKSAIQVINLWSLGFYNCRFLSRRQLGTRKWSSTFQHWVWWTDTVYSGNFVNTWTYNFYCKHNFHCKDSMRGGNFMLLIDFQVHTHQTQKYLHLICNERVFYFKAPCFGLVTAPLCLHRYSA